MGYLGNHLATIVTGVFAAILTALWPIFVNFAPVLDFVFIMAVPIMWFLVFTCWIAQKSADYMHANQQQQHHHSDGQQQIVISKDGDQQQHNEKKSLANNTTDTQNEISNLQSVQNELLDDVNGLKESLKLKDSEIERLNRQIANLQTRVQIETIRAELANLKMLASKQKK